MLDLEGLNAPQKKAVLHGDGPLVVFAGAGSGKTRVITHRVAHLITERDVAPWRILAVTFTNKAAGEMRERLFQLIGGGAKGLQVGTFHSTCARILRWNAERLGLRKDFTIYDDSDQKAALKRVLKDLNLDEKRFPVKTVAGTINRHKQEVLGPEEMDIEGAYDEIVQRVYRTYTERLQKASALDFGDLIYRLVVALEKDEEFRTELAGRFRYQLVDEFQDTNHAQLRLVKALASVHPNLCVVGDDDQSIYRWRGADRRNILDFKRMFPGTQVIKLEQNYRSTQRILRIAHAVIRRNLEREPKQMWTDNPEGEPVFVLRTADERTEALEVVNGVKEIVGAGGALSDVAVFYRTHAQSRVIEEALRGANISYRIVGGVRFYDRAEVKDLLGYLRVLTNPDDDVSLLRIINTPSRGIGKTTLNRLLDLAAETGRGVWSAMELVGDDDRFGSAARRKLGAFRELMNKLAQGLQSGRNDLDDIGGVILHETGYLQQLKDEDTPEADARIQNLEELIGTMQQFAQSHPEANLSDWLAEVTLQTDVQEEEDGFKDRLTLMTVHAAKGLEFDTVIATGLEEGLFPRKGTEVHEDPEELEEERRLAYVAFTRARKQLVLTYATRRFIFGRQQPCDPSRFLHEIPSEDARWLGGQPTPAGYGGRSYGRRGGGYGGYSGGGYGGRASGGRSSGHRELTMDEGRQAAARLQADPWDSPPAGPDLPEGVGTESYIDYSEGSDWVLRKGMQVRHAKFGVGEVRDISQGSPPRVTVLFPGWGRKTIVARFLQPL